jgi:hypothetical protein
MAFTGKKREKPAPEPQAPATTPAAPVQGKTSNARRPWLKAEHMPTMNGVELDIQIGSEIRLYTGGEFGQQLILAVTDENNKEFDWSIKIGGQQFLRLEKKFGKNLLGWPEKVVAVTRNEFDGKPYVEVVESQG